MNSSSKLRDPEKKSSVIYVYLIAMIAAAGGFIWGYDLVIMSSVILYLEPHFDLSSTWVGWAMTSATFGIWVGILMGGYVSDWIGRKRTLILAAVLFAVSAVWTAIPRTFFDWNVFRIVGGIGGGLAMMVSPMYIAEIAPADRRGQLVTLNQLAIVLGAFLSAVVAYLIAENVKATAILEITGQTAAAPGTSLTAEGNLLVDEHLNATAWRWMLGSECIPIIPFVIGLLFVPRSPRWLVQQNREDEARRVLTRIGGPEYAERELVDISATPHKEKGQLRELFQPGIRWALLIAVGLSIYQQLGGQSSMTLYAPTLFEDAGVGSKEKAILYTVILRIWNTACTILALLMVDKLGRRPLLIWGLAGMSLSHFLYGIGFQNDMDAKFLLGVLFLGEAAYIMSIAPIAWLVISEIFPTRLRAKGVMVSALFLQVFAYLVNFLFPIVKDYFEERSLPGGLFWAFSFICFTAVLFSWKFVFETKGKSLEEITDILRHEDRGSRRGESHP